MSNKFNVHIPKMKEFKVEKQLNKLKLEYRANEKLPIRIDFRKKVTKMLNGHSHENKPLHYIHTYPGRVSPHIVSYFLSLKEFSSLKGYVLDPFAGSGTILLEALINPILKRPALGIEINPLARLIAKVKTSIIVESQIENGLSAIRENYRLSRMGSYPVRDFININFWFSANAKRKLSRLKYAIEITPLNHAYRDFFWVCFSKIVRRVSKTDPNIAPPVLLKPFKYKHNKEEYKKLRLLLKHNETPNVLKLFEESVKENTKITLLNGVKEIKENGKLNARIISANAKTISMGRAMALGKMSKGNKKKLRANSIDLIVTSPPYLTAQKYIRSTRLELLWLGYTSKDLSSFERATIGSENVRISTKTSKVGTPSIDLLVESILRKSKERGIMVYEYFYDMKIVLTELFRVLKEGGYAILIMGDNVVLKKRVKTYRLLTDMAKRIGFKELVILKDRIRNRSMLPSRNGTGGLIKYEYVIILRKQKF